MTSATYQPPVNGSTQSAKQVAELNELVLGRVRELTPQEGFQTLIASGIYTSDGKLAKEYLHLAGAYGK